MRRHIAYAKYVLRHKWYVFWECLKLGLSPFTAFSHDWDKFYGDEWFPYARTFYASDGAKQYKESPEFAYAWMLHQHRNPHHWQYWLDADGTPLFMTNILVWDRGEAQRVIRFNSGSDFRLELRSFDGSLVPNPMPERFLKEMLADWRGAGKALGSTDTKAWYEKMKSKMILHPDTRAWIEEQLGVSHALR
jgi:hypothetical protein